MYYYKEYVKFIKGNDDLAELNIVRLIDQTLKELGKEVIYSDEEKRFYLYKDGFWQQADNEYIISIYWRAYSNHIFPKMVFEAGECRKRLKSITSNMPNADALRAKETHELKRYDYFIKLKQKNIKEFIESLGMSCERIPDTNYTKIPLMNGYIDIEKDFEFFKVDPYIYNRYVLDFNYTKTTKEPSYFLKFLEQILPSDEDREFLLNWLAYVLVVGNYRQKALFLYGSGRNGKGVLSRIIHRLIGKQNASTLTVQQLSSEKYYLGQMNNKLLNICPDSDDKDKIDIGAFKTLTGNDNITVRDIYAKPFNMVYDGKMMFSINKVPYFSSKDVAIMERVEILNFPVTIQEKDRIPNLENIILEKEGDAIFNFLLERVKELKKINFKFKAPASVRNFTNEIMDEQDNISSFIVEHINERENETKWEMPLTMFYNQYKDYSTEGGFKALNRTNFKETLIKWEQRRKDINIEYTSNGKNYVFKFEKQTTSIPLVIEDANGRVLGQQDLTLDEEAPF